REGRREGDSRRFRSLKRALPSHGLMCGCLFTGEVVRVKEVCGVDELWIECRNGAGGAQECASGGSGARTAGGRDWFGRFADRDRSAGGGRAAGGAGERVGVSERRLEHAQRSVARASISARGADACAVSPG